MMRRRQEVNSSRFGQQSNVRAAPQRLDQFLLNCPTSVIADMDNALGRVGRLFDALHAMARLVVKWHTERVYQQVPHQVRAFLGQDADGDGVAQSCSGALDVTNEDHWIAALEGANAAMGGISGLVNNAGITSREGGIEELSLEGFRRLMSVNVDSVFLGAKHGIKYLA